MRRRHLWFLPPFVLAAALIALAFQNCSEVSFSTSAQPSSGIKFQNNGGSYGGKFAGTFHRFVPDFACEQTPAPHSTVEISATDVTLTENKRLRCAAVKQRLPLSSLDISIYQKDVVGYGEGIFELEKSAPSSIPANLVEVWCRDRKDSQGIETITHYDRVLRQGVTRIHYSEFGANSVPVAKTIADFGVARVISGKTIWIRDRSGFDLTVHRDQPAAELGLFKGRLKASIGGVSIERETSCRLGGSLDSTVWPAQQIVDTAVKNVGVSPDGSSIAFLSRLFGGSGYELFSAKTDGSSLRLMSEKGTGLNLIGGGNVKAVFTPDSKKLVFESFIDQAPVYSKATYAVSLDLASSEPVQPVVSAPLLSFRMLDEKSALMNFDQSGTTNFAARLSRVDLLLGLVQGLNPPSSVSSTVKGLVDGFDVSKSRQRAVYLWTDNASNTSSENLLDLYSVKFDGGDLKKISPALAAGWRLVGWDRGYNVPGGGDYVFVKSQSGLGASTLTQYHAVAIDGSGVTALPIGWTWSFVDTQSRWAFIHPVHGATPVLSNAALLNLQTGQQLSLPPMETYSLESHLPIGVGLGSASVNIPIETQFSPELDRRRLNHPSHFFSEDGLELIGRSRLSSGLYRGIVISTLTGALTELCAGVASTELFIVPLDALRSLVLTFDPSTRALDLHVRTRGSGCKKVNSAMTAAWGQNSIRDVVVSPDLQSALLRVSRWDPATGAEGDTELLWLPLDGRAAHQVNSPVATGMEISTARFARDSRTVIFVGNQIKPSEHNVFLWRAPVAP